VGVIEAKARVGGGGALLSVRLRTRRKEKTKKGRKELKAG